jgi:glycosyltransferase involved in cell wall biosynthesis
MSLLRVAHVVQGLEVGGLERVVLALARSADPRRVRMEVICTTSAGALAEAIERSGVPVHRLALADYYPGSVLSLARLLARLAPDVVHTHGHFAGVAGRAAAWWAGVPLLVQHLHTIDPTLRPRHLWLERRLARITARVVCCSRAVAAHAIEVLGLPASIVMTVPNGIEPPPAAGREEALERLGRPAPPIVGCVGALRPHKGQEVLLEAVRLGPPAPSGTVVLIGGGPDRERLERLAAGAPGGWSVRFTGERTDARSLIPAFDVAVVPSLREGLGLAALEAMDAACPVVASRTGGLPEAVEEGVTGWLVPPGDAAALAAALREALADPGLRKRRGLAGRQRVESRFRAAAMSRALTAVYEEGIDARRAA